MFFEYTHLFIKKYRNTKNICGIIDLINTKKKWPKNLFTKV